MDNSGASAEPDETLLDWTVHPARDRPRQVPWVVFYLAVIVAVLHACFGSLLLTLVGAGLMVGAVGDFLFPARYRLTARGAERLGPAGRKALAWDRVRAAYLTREGVKLSSMERPSWLESWRGLFLPWDGQRDEVLALVDRYATARRRPEGEQADDQPGA